MSFCGTIALERRWRMLGFGMHCSGMASQLLDLKYKRTSEEKRAGEKEEQMRLFNLTNEQREEFLKFAGNLRWLVDDHKVQHTEDGVTSDSFWEGYRKYEYTDYEIMKLVENVIGVIAVADVLERAANGEELTDDQFKFATNLLHSLSARAHARMDDGGCF